MSARDKVPKLIKDPKFTRTGIVRRKTKNRNYDLTQPHIKNPELYYNEKVDKPLERKKDRELRKLKRGLPELTIGEPRELKSILQDLTNEEFLLHGSSRLIINIHELEKHHADKVEKNLDAIHGALRVLNHKLPLLSFREFGILVTLNDRYNPNDKQLWTEIALNLQRAIQGWLEYEKDVLAVESLQKNLVHVSNSVYNASKRLDIDIKDLAKLLRRAFVEKTGAISDVKNLILFYTTLAKMPGDTPSALLAKVAEQALAKKEKLSMIDIVWLIHSVSKAYKAESKSLEPLVNLFIEKFNGKAEQRIDRIAIVAQSLANAKLSHPKFADLAGKYVESNLGQLKNVKDLCFVAESFVKLGIVKPNVFSHIEKTLEPQIQELGFNSIRQLIYSVTGNPGYKPEFIKKIYERIKKIVELEVGDVDSRLTNKDMEFIVKNCRFWDTPDGKFNQTEVYYTLLSALGTESKFQSAPAH